MNDPLKIMKCGRFSQILRDRISERRRKGSRSPLVVETGFPTSIIDLFVKNKDKLKNPLLKNKIKNDIRTSNKIGNDCNYVVNDDPSPPPPTPLRGGGVVEEDNEVVVENRSGKEKECVHGNMVSIAVLRLFLVVVLALGTKMFVLGITFSAFLLLFVENLVKQQLIRPPCIYPKGKTNLMVKKIMGFVRIRKGNPEESNLDSKAAMEIQEEQVMMVNDNRRGDSEIEIGENEIHEKKIDVGEGKSEVLYIRDIISAEEGEELRSRKSRRARMKVKMRGFLSKRLRKKKTQNVDDGGDSAASIADEDGQKELSSYGGSSLSSISRDIDEIVELSINQNEQETSTQLIEQETTTQLIEHSSSSSSYEALVVVVLVGLLLGGRGLALILTVSWCLLLKSGSAIGRRYIKRSILRSPHNAVHQEL